MSSYEKINYSLRPAKSVERKMMCEAFRRLSAFGRLDSYRYIGFGSPYFTDFSLFHRALGIGDMISIEKDEENKDRFLANRPFDCIRMEFGLAGDILPKLDWNNRCIVWLDYDGSMKASVLSDVRGVCSVVAPGSFVVISVNAQPLDVTPRRPSSSADAEDASAEAAGSPPQDKKAHDVRLAHLRSAVGNAKVPANIVERDLRQWGTALACRLIFQNEVEETLAARNGGRKSQQLLKYRQLFHFNYADGAKMLTVGGIVHDAGQEHVVEQCAFDALEFVRRGAEPYLIEVPNLTFREMARMDACLPEQGGGMLPAVPKRDTDAYVRLYRFFPKFAETEF